MPAAPRRLAFTLVAAVAVVVIGLFVRARTSGDGAQAAKAPEPAGAQRAVPVTLAEVERKDMPIWLEGLGTVVAWQQVTVRAQVDGRLDKVFFTEGQAVHKGDVLAQIDPRPFSAQLHQAEGALSKDKSTLHDAQINLERYRELRAQKLIAQQQLDDQSALAGQAEGAVHADEAQIETARLNLDYARVKAPIDGVVGVRLVDPGNLVRQSDATGLVVITELDPAALFITVPEDVLPSVTAAMARGEVPVEAWSRDGLTRLGQGSLYVIDNQINSATATLRLKAKLPNPERKLWPNQFVKARLLLETRKDATVVPAAALQRGAQGVYVYLAGADGKAQQRPVEVATTVGDAAIIGKGLAPGERVVVEGQSQLRPGATLQARDGEAGLKQRGGAAGGGEQRGGAAGGGEQRGGAAGGTQHGGGEPHGGARTPAP